MAIPNAPSFASFDVTARTEGRAVDSVIWDYMFAKSRLLEVVGTGPRINQQRFEWVNIGAPAISVTIAETASNTTIDSSGSGQAIEFSPADMAKLMVGAVLVNTSRATPIGTQRRNELMQVTDITGNIATVTRDAGSFNSGTGSTAHAIGDVLRILYIPHQEGSAAVNDPNAYRAQTILENYSAIQTIKLQVTGSQLARAMEVVASDMERQYAREMLNLKNQLVSLLLYGYNSNPAVGSDTVIRNVKGLQDFLVDNINASNPLVDYTTTALTRTALNAMFERLWNNGADPSEPYKIVTSGIGKRVISSWESQYVRTTYEEQRIGKEIKEFVSDLGFTVEVIADPMVLPSDLFIVQPEKLKVIPFRPFERTEWGIGTSTPNGDDMYYTRVIGEHTVQVVDPGMAHAAMTNLTWNPTISY